MKLTGKSFKNGLLIFSFSALLISCEEMNSKMEEQLNNINENAVQLDSAVNRGLDKVESLDSTITSKTDRIKDLDSVVRNTGTRIDSIVNNSAREINNQLNY